MTTDQKQIDVFVYRLLASIGCVMGAILAVYSAHLAFHRIPAVEASLRDFDLALPAMTLFVFRVPWLPLAVSFFGACFGGFAVFSVKKRAIASCWVAVLLGLALVLLVQHFLEAPLNQLMQSMGGV